MGNVFLIIQITNTQLGATLWDFTICVIELKNFFNSKKFQCLISGYWNNNGTCYDDSLFPCKSSKQCILKVYKCDGHIQCPGGEDEAFELCENTFPKEATVKCNETSDIEIMAFRNDGVKGGLSSEVILVFVLFFITFCSSNRVVAKYSAHDGF